jgi:hypothetical protein
MVTAYMQGAAAGRAMLGERLSVIALAVRLRLAGVFAAPRRRASRQAAHALGWMILLYQALAATASVGFTVMLIIESTVDPALRTLHPRPIIVEIFTWSELLPVLWVASFVCVVLGRVGAGRLLAVLAFASHVGVTSAIYAMVGSWPGFTSDEAIRWVWAVASVGAAMLVPAPDRRVRRRWIGGYLAGGLVLLASGVQYFAPRLPLLARFTSFEQLSQLALLAAMAVALAVAASRPSPAWLLALATFGGGIGAVHLIRRNAPMPAMDGEPVPTAMSRFFAVSTSFDLVLLAFAAVCAVVGLAALRRLPSPPHETGARS